jgi:hypothetical protein
MCSRDRLRYIFVEQLLTARASTLSESSGASICKARRKGLEIEERRAFP